MSAQRPRQPWPMKWVFVAILVVIVPYTFLRWHYRKPGRAFEPYHDMKERANTLRLLNAGFQRITLDAERPADPSRGLSPAPSFPAPGGLPEALATTLVDRPLLPDQIGAVSAAPRASTLLAYPIEFTCTLPDNKQLLDSAQLYVRGSEIYLVTSFEKLTGGLLARTRDNVIRVTVPPGALKPGRYHVTLIGSRGSKAWDLDVN